ncbi:MAG TPA: 4-alpha-glucanotransferase, partial [Bryobacteraceae bacterium]|nr:4-alpha-glucanotransferase [Bryobacteraceae bacterium]
PPDNFSAQGQLWGNPVYDWAAHARTSYAWWIDRLRALLAHVDLIRLDHFRGFAAAWHVPAGARTAETGEWVLGPGADFFRVVQKELGSLPFFAEDLGLITPDVSALREQFDIPGTRVLQFAFDGDVDNVHLPDNYSANTVVYTGTHDNATTREWFEQLPNRDKRSFSKYSKRPAGDHRNATPEMIRIAWSSPAALAIAPLQDLLNLGSQSRMNIPGTADGNWRWRATPHMMTCPDFEWLRKLTSETNRTASIRSMVREES